MSRVSQHRHYTWLDRAIVEFHAGLSTLLRNTPPKRDNPASLIPDVPLSAREKKQSQGYMRVNHSGEVCAQALYRGQACVAKTPEIQALLENAALEETDHLSWCHTRLSELHTHTSYLNLFWYTNAFCIGLLMGLFGDAWSLGFIEETEKQVSDHLDSHLHRLPKTYLKSRAIIEQMQQDEIRHGQTAHQQGATTLPYGMQQWMRCQASIMTTLTYWL